MNKIDHIQVSVRIKPILDDEHNKFCVRIDPNLNDTVVLDAQNEQRVFSFDHVATDQASQTDIFTMVGKPCVQQTLTGYNGCIFAYGQTGAGKTFTMVGSNDSAGVLPRALEYLFDQMNMDLQQNLTAQYLVKCSYLEIYNEHIIDLLNPQTGNLTLREDLKRGVYVEFLTEEICTNLNQAMNMLQRGNQNRHIASTNMNIESSRSHSVFSLQVESSRQSVQTLIKNHRYARLNFVDLAGSERQKLSQAQGERLREGCNINKSLHILGNVINSLVELSQSQQSRYVHYRDSKLTFLLKDSLGGNSRTHLIANVHQSATHYQETLSTLQFAKRVKQVQNKAFVNEDDSGNLNSLKNEIKRLKTELAKRTVEQEFVWENPKQDQSMMLQSQNFLQSLEAETLLFSDQKYLKLEELLKCYLEQSTETETQLHLQLEKSDEVINDLKVLSQEGKDREVHLRTIIQLQQSKQQRLGIQEDQIGNIVQQIQVHPIVWRVIEENLDLKESGILNHGQIIRQLSQNIYLLNSLHELLQESLSERKSLHNQLEGRLQQKYISPQKYHDLESQLESKEKYLGEQLDSLKKEITEFQIKLIIISLKLNQEAKDQECEKLQMEKNDLSQDVLKANLKIDELKMTKNTENEKQESQQNDLQSELSTLKLENEESLGKIDKLQHELQKKQIEQERLIDRQQQNLKEYRRIIKGLENDVSLQRLFVHEKDQQVKEVGVNFEALQESNSDVRRRNIDLQQQIEMLEFQLQKEQKDLFLQVNCLQQTVESNETALRNKEERIKDLQQQLKLETCQYQQDIDTLQQTLEFKEKDHFSEIDNQKQNLIRQQKENEQILSKLHEENDILVSKLNQHNIKVDELMVSAKSQESLIYALNQKQNQLEDYNQILQEDKVNLNQQNIKLQQIIEDLEQQKIKEQKEFNQQIHNYLLEIDQCQTSLRSKDERIDEVQKQLKSEIIQREQELCALEQIILTNQTQHANEKQMQNELLQQLESKIQSDQGEQQSVYVSLKDENSKLQSKLTDCQQILSGLEMELNNHRNELSISKALISSIQQENQELQQMTTELKQRQNERISQAETSIQVLQKHKQDLQSQLQSLQGDNIKIQSEINFKNEELKRFKEQIQTQQNSHSQEVLQLEQIIQSKEKSYQQMVEMEKNHSLQLEQKFTLDFTRNQQEYDTQNQKQEKQFRSIIAGLEKEIHQQRQITLEEEILLNQSQNTIQELQQNKLDVERQLADQSKKLELLEIEFQKEKRNLQQLVNNHQMTIEQNSNLLRTKDAKIKELEQQIKLEIFQYQLQIETLEQLLLSKEKDYNSEVENQRNQYEQLEQEFGNEQVKYQEEYNQVLNEVNQLTRLIQTKEKDYNSLQTEFSTKLETLDATKSQLQVQIQAYDNLNQQYNKKVQENKLIIENSTLEEGQRQNLYQSVVELREVLVLEKKRSKQFFIELEQQREIHERVLQTWQGQCSKMEQEILELNGVVEEFNKLKLKQEEEYQMALEVNHQLEQRINQIDETIMQKDLMIQKSQAQAKQREAELKQDLYENEQTLQTVHDKAKEFCRQQEREISEIKDQYLKLEDEHNGIIDQNQQFQLENDQLIVELQHIQEAFQIQANELKHLKYSDMKLKKESNDLNEKYNKLQSEKLHLTNEIENLQNEISQLMGHNNPAQKVRYLNQVKQENCILKQERHTLQEQLTVVTEERNKLLQRPKNRNQSPVRKEESDYDRVVQENMRLQNDISKLNAILNIPFSKKHNSQPQDVDKILQSVQLLIQDLVDCKSQIQVKDRELEQKHLKHQSLEKDLLLLRQKFYNTQRENSSQVQYNSTETTVLKDNKQQRTIKSNFQFQ